MTDFWGLLEISQERVQKLVIILMISMKMCVSPTREDDFEAWGFPRSLKTKPRSLNVLPWMHEERSLGRFHTVTDSLLWVVFSAHGEA